MGVELVVLDFDGTLTDVDQEAVPFVEGYKTSLAKRLDLKREELDAGWNEKEAIIKSNPSQYGWLMSGRIVAPAHADPLVMSRTIAGLLLKDKEDFGEREREGLREEILDALFRENYGKLGTAFKDETNDFLTALKNQFQVCIVTNSGTSGVEKKVAQLPSDHSAIPIHGDAKKYVLVPEWNDVPEHVERAGFGRPLFLQRQRYWNVLSQMMEARGLSAAQVAVVGDIYELDLLLPEYQGMNVILAPRASTPTFEIQAVKTSPRGYVARSLQEGLTYLESRRT